MRQRLSSAAFLVGILADVFWSAILFAFLVSIRSAREEFGNHLLF